MAVLDVLRLLKFAAPFVFTILWKKLIAIPSSYYNRLTYKPGHSPKNIVIIGGSFAGISLAKCLTQILPSGFRIILIEKSSHFNTLFPFPRFSVIPGHEHKAFIPYDEIIFSGRKGVPRGIFKRRKDAVVEIRADSVVLASGELVPYAYLAVATGTSSPYPSKLLATEKREECAELRAIQHQIRDADRIAVVGGGAVGVELVTDIKSYYPDKDVTLVHSRDRLLHGYGARLHERVLEAMGKLGVVTRLGQRPKIVSAVVEKGTRLQDLQFPDGSAEAYDLVIPCTGQTPNTAIMRQVFPDSISPDSGRILVRPSLEIESAQNVPGTRFALGDVAETGGPKMGRAATIQAEIVARNIVALIKGKNAANIYTPIVAIEGAIHVTLGISEAAIYAANEKGEDALFTVNHGREDAQVSKLWMMMGAKFDEAVAAKDA